MSVISISLQSCQLQSLFSDTQRTTFLTSPPKNKNLFAVELEHCASQLMDWLEKTASKLSIKACKP